MLYIVNIRSAAAESTQYDINQEHMKHFNM